MTYEQALAKLEEIKIKADVLASRILADINETNDATDGNFGIGFHAAINDTLESLENLVNVW